MSNVGNQVKLRIGINRTLEQIVLEFDQEVRWIGLTVEDSIALIETLVNKIDLLGRGHEGRGHSEASGVGSEENRGPGKLPG